MVEPTLQISEITLRFGGVTALDQVSFAVAPATIHALIGPNGAGKSSCFNVLSGLYRPSSGSVRLHDGIDGARELTSLAPHQIAALGVARAFQNIALAGSQTVEDNIMVARHHLTRTGFVAAGLRLPSARREEAKHRARVRQIAEFLDLTDRLDVPARLLPYGDRKRVEMARALATEPRLLLLDEPVAGMNHHESWAMARAIQQVRDVLGVCVVLVEHDMPLVMRIADRISVLDFGRLIADGTPDQVRTDPEVVRAYLGTTDLGTTDTDPIEVIS